MTNKVYENTVIPAHTNRSCPQCHSTYLDRVKRRLIDRAVGVVVPLKRYHCASCGWIGNLKSCRD